MTEKSTDELNYDFRTITSMLYALRSLGPEKNQAPEIILPNRDGRERHLRLMDAFAEILARDGERVAMCMRHQRGVNSRPSAYVCIDHGTASTIDEDSTVPQIEIKGLYQKELIDRLSSAPLFQYLLENRLPPFEDHVSTVLHLARKSIRSKIDCHKRNAAFRSYWFYNMFHSAPKTLRRFSAGNLDFWTCLKRIDPSLGIEQPFVVRDLGLKLTTKVRGYRGGEIFQQNWPKLEMAMTHVYLDTYCSNTAVEFHQFLCRLLGDIEDCLTRIVDPECFDIEILSTNLRDLGESTWILDHLLRDESDILSLHLNWIGMLLQTAPSSQPNQFSSVTPQPITNIGNIIHGYNYNQSHSTIDGPRWTRLCLNWLDTITAARRASMKVYDSCLGHTARTCLPDMDVNIVTHRTRDQKMLPWTELIHKMFPENNWGEMLINYIQKAAMRAEEGSELRVFLKDYNWENGFAGSCHPEAVLAGIIGATEEKYDRKNRIRQEGIMGFEISKQDKAQWKKAKKQRQKENRQKLTLQSSEKYPNGNETEPSPSTPQRGARIANNRKKKRKSSSASSLSSRLEAEMKLKEQMRHNVAGFTSYEFKMIEPTLGLSHHSCPTCRILIHQTFRRHPARKGRCRVYKTINISSSHNIFIPSSLPPIMSQDQRDSLVVHVYITLQTWLMEILYDLDPSCRPNRSSEDPDDTLSDSSDSDYYFEYDYEDAY
ncbi:hypothetical protein EDC01DRAFT_653379 [Geopyxis carbonaria]|nr:hypothetical protein EDC01DRAFT_653379 [Geopyxis carbonaria]